VNIFFAGWKPDGSGIRPGGDCGGDRQRGGSYSLRFRHPDLPGAVIIRTAYAAESEYQPGEFFVQVQTEWILCTDPERPGDTETWSRAGYEDRDRTWATAGEAEADARGRVLGDVAGDAYCLNWEGEPW
jgi:hypothetical protein